MAEEDKSQERTEQATPKRQKEAREQGQVPRSRELNTMILLLAGATSLFMMGEGLLRQIVELMQRSLSIERQSLMDVRSLPLTLAATVLDALVILAPLLLILLLAAIVAPLMLGGISFSAKSISFKWSKLDPIKGFGRIFAWRGLMELGKTLAKFTFVAAASALLLWQLLGTFMNLGSESVYQGLAHVGALLLWAFLLLSGALLLIVVIDVPFQIWDHSQRLKMTRQEVRDEMKETEGQPEVRQKIRNLQREMAQRRMMEEVPKADVVIVNPTHYAVALRFSQKMNAPRVVAKGSDLVAGRIREIAEKNEVLIFSAPPLARALYFNTDLGKEIPTGLYLAVAQVLAYVYQLRNVRAGGGEPPALPTELPVPDEYLNKG